MSSIHSVFQEIPNKIKDDVEAIKPEELISADIENLAQQFVAKYSVECASLAGQPEIEELPFAPNEQYPLVTVHLPVSGNGRRRWQTKSSLPLP